MSPESPKKQSSNAHSQRALSAYARAEVPTVRATLPGEELLSGRHGADTASEHQEVVNSRAAPLDTINTSTGGTHTSSSPKRPFSPTKARDLSLFPRRFHLKKSAPATFPHSHGPTSGIQKRKKGQKPDIAVFVERARELKKHKSSSSTDNTAADVQAFGEVTDIQVPTAQVGPPTIRKRPNPSAVEKHWRAEQWGQKVPQRLPAALPKSGISIDTDPSRWDRDSIQLAKELQQFAVQHTNGSGGPAELLKPISNLKFKPKVPARRHQDTQLQSATMFSSRDNEMELGINLEDEGEYVYDTYARQPSKPGKASVNLESMHLVSEIDGGNGKIGVLVITEEDQEIWETYAEDEDSEKDWNSEEEDENGTSCIPLPL